MAVRVFVALRDDTLVHVRATTLQNPCKYRTWWGPWELVAATRPRISGSLLLFEKRLQHTNQTWRTPPWLASGWGCRGRRLSTGPENLGTRPVINICRCEVECLGVELRQFVDRTWRR